MPILWSCPARKTRQRPDGLALKKDQLIVQDLPVGRGQAHGPRVACRSIDRYTDKSLLHDVKEPNATLIERAKSCSGRYLHEDGGADRDRTGDLKLAKLALSQLSYGPFRKSEVGGQKSEERMRSVCYPTLLISEF